jgi:glycine cleavage system pyridoxal-binding protein P
MELFIDKSYKIIYKKKKIKTEYESKISDLPENLIKLGYKSWDELIVVIPHKMEDKSLKYHIKREKKLMKLIDECK